MPPQSGRGIRANAVSGRRAKIKGAQAERGLSWRSLWADGQRLCYLCGLECDPDDALGPRNLGPRYPSLDHIVPVSRGGQHISRNVALACLDCNKRKSNRMLAPPPAAA